ncbi:hypothetical protein Ahia01_000653600 [Argonauta hians]
MLKSMANLFTKRRRKQQRCFDEDYNAANAFILLITEKMDELTNKKNVLAIEDLEIKKQSPEENFYYQDDIDTSNNSAINKNLHDSHPAATTNVREIQTQINGHNILDISEESCQNVATVADELSTSQQVYGERLKPFTSDLQNYKGGTNRDINRGNRKIQADYSWLFDSHSPRRLHCIDRGKLRECCQLMTYDQSIFAYKVLQHLLKDISEPSDIPFLLDQIIMHILDQEEIKTTYRDFINPFRIKNLSESNWQWYLRPFGRILSLFFPNRFKKSSELDSHSNNVECTANFIKEYLMKNSTVVFINRKITEPGVLEWSNGSNVVYVQRVSYDRTEAQLEVSNITNHKSRVCYKINKLDLRNLNTSSNNMLQPKMYDPTISRTQFKMRKRVIKRHSQAVTVRVIRDLNPTSQTPNNI